MRYYLTNLISSLSKEEVRYFKIYNTRFKYLGEAKKVIQLFDLIRIKKVDEYDASIIDQFYDSGSKNAFYRLKNRLVSDIEASIVQMNQKNDEESTIYYNLHLAKIFFHKSDYEKSLNYLEKARKIAEKTNRYDLLNTIYSKYIKLTRYNSKLDIDKYIDLSKNNLELLEITTHNDLLISKVNFKLRKSNFSGKNELLSQMLDDIVNELKMKSEFLKTPLLRFQMNHCVRGILLEKKDFSTLIEYLTSSYKEFKNEKLFNQEFHEEKLILLSWIVNTLPRSGNFNQINIYINELQEALTEFGGLHSANYRWLYYQTKVIYYSFSRKINEAIELIKGIQEDNTLTVIPHYHIFTHFNLSVLYFYLKDYGASLSAISNIILSSDFNKNAVNWQMAISLVEIILRIENKDLIFANNRCAEFSRRFKKQLKDEKYSRERDFLRILKGFTSLSNPISNPKQLHKISDFIEKSPQFEPGANEAINYKLWLISKLEKRDYYEVMLETFDGL